MTTSSHTTTMEIFDSDRHSPLLPLVDKFVNYLASRFTQLKKDSKRNNGIRFIQGERIEILLEKCTFKHLVEKCFKDDESEGFTVEDFQQYIEQVVSDDEDYNMPKIYKSFSIIISKGPVPMQCPHLDTTG